MKQLLFALVIAVMAITSIPTTISAQQGTSGKYAIIPATGEVNGLPAEMEVEYSGQIDAKTFFVIYRPKEDWNYADFRVLIGRSHDLREVKMLSTERMRDGGTTFVETQTGNFYFPAFQRNKGTFNDRPLRNVYQPKRRS